MSPAGKAAAVGILMASFLVWLWLYGAQETEDEVETWLKQQDLAHLRAFSPFRQLTSLEELVRLDLDFLPEALQASSSLPDLRNGLQLLELQLWLREGEMEEFLPQLVAAGHSSIHSLQALGSHDVKKLATQLLPAELGDIFHERLRKDISTTHSGNSISTLVYVFLGLLLVAFSCIIAFILCVCCVILSEISSRQQRANLAATSSRQQRINWETSRLRDSPWLREALGRMTRDSRTPPVLEEEEEEEEEENFLHTLGDRSGGALDPDRCRLEWNQDDPAVVGTSSVATLHLVRCNFAPYELLRSDHLKVTVRNTATRIPIPHMVEPALPTNHSQLHLLFTARQAGTYSLHVRLNGRSLAGTPVSRTFLPDRGNWSVMRVFADCLRFLLQPPHQHQRQTNRPAGSVAGSSSPHHNQSEGGLECDPGRCHLEWNQDDRAPVGGASVATLHLVSRGSTPYKMTSLDSLTVTIRHTSTKAIVPHVVEPAPPTNHSQLRLSFSTRQAGTYSLHLQLNGRSLAGTPVNRTFLPGPVDPAKTSFPDQPQWLVLTAGTYHSMTVIPRDSFGNSAIIEQDHLTVNIRKGGSEGELVNPECVVERVPATSQFELLLKVDNSGHYVGCVSYKGETIGPPQFTIICLTPSEADELDKNLQKRNLNLYYEATLTSKGHHKKVYCYLYPKQLQVKEYYFILFHHRLYTCKVCPSSTIHLSMEEGEFTVDDGYQPPISLRSKHREIIAATYYKYLLKNIGGSEQFQDKRAFFNSKLRSHHSKEPRGEKHLRINRFNLLGSAMKETKGFSASDWHKRFTVTFIGEEALDWGGVSREFFHLLCTQCFNCANGMFRRFKDDPQALVHPNPHHPPTITSLHYQFAGRLVGKCLLETALGNSLQVSARFARSFLAQIIGLRMNYKYFESDDPDLYVSKIQYIRENDVTDLELVFAEEEFSDNGTVKVVPLVEGGVEKPVTEENKTQYLNLLAQYRLAQQTRTEVEHFLKGLHDLIPDNLLGIFDENELELLMCGTDTVSYEDLKKHAVVSHSSNSSFRRVVSWFWHVVSGFTGEEMARLLQFVTGSSQLPPGGFKDLSPKFQITSAPTHGRLPSAHTCFNQLCLPEYDSCEQFQTALMLALNEGTEGFGFL